MTQKTLTYEEFEKYLQDLNDMGMIIYPICVEQIDSSGNTIIKLEVTQKRFDVKFVYDFSIYAKEASELKIEIVHPLPPIPMSFEQEVSDISVTAGLKLWKDEIQKSCEHTPMAVGTDLYCAKCSMHLG